MNQKNLIIFLEEYILEISNSESDVNFLEILSSPFKLRVLSRLVIDKVSISSSSSLNSAWSVKATEVISEEIKVHILMIALFFSLSPFPFYRAHRIYHQALRH